MTTTLSITPTRMIASAGKFDSQKRYLYKLGAVSGSNNIKIPIGKTIQIHSYGFYYNLASVSWNTVPNHYSAFYAQYESWGIGGVGNPGAGLPAPTTSSFATNVEVANTLNIDLKPHTSGSYISFDVTSLPAVGTLTWVDQVGGIVQYSSPIDASVGADAFSFRALGTGGASNVSSCTVNVTASTKPAPVADDASFYVSYSPYNFTLPVTYVPSGLSSVTIVTPPSHGTVDDDSGSILNKIYTPSITNGSDSFTYKAHGPGGDSATKTVTFNVNTAGVPPPFASNMSLIVSYSPYPLTLPVLGDVSSITIVTPPTKGTLSDNGSLLNKLYTTSNTSGTDSFTYKATGAGGDSAIKTVNMTLTSGGSAPVTVSASVDADYGSDRISVDLSTLASGTYSSIQIVSAPSHGSWKWTTSTYTLVYVTDTTGDSTVNFTFRTSDTFSNTSTLTVTFDDAVLSPPTVTNYASVVNPGIYGANLGKVNLYPAVSPETTSIQIVTQPAYGTITPEASSTWVDFLLTASVPSGTADSCTFRAVGPGGVSEVRTLSLTIVPYP